MPKPSRRTILDSFTIMAAYPAAFFSNFVINYAEMSTSSEDTRRAYMAMSINDHNGWNQTSPACNETLLTDPRTESVGSAIPDKVNMGVGFFFAYQAIAALVISVTLLPKICYCDCTGDECGPICCAPVTAMFGLAALAFYPFSVYAPSTIRGEAINPPLTSMQALNETAIALATDYPNCDAAAVLTPWLNPAFITEFLDALRKAIAAQASGGYVSIPKIPLPSHSLTPYWITAALTQAFGLVAVNATKRFCESVSDYRSASGSSRLFNSQPNQPALLDKAPTEHQGLGMA